MPHTSIIGRSFPSPKEAVEALHSAGFKPEYDKLNRQKCWTRVDSKLQKTVRAETHLNPKSLRVQVVAYVA